MYSLLATKYLYYRDGDVSCITISVCTCLVACFITAEKDDSNLVDSASSHTLVSKIKPCMCKYKYCTLKLRTAHYISDSLFDNLLLLGQP